MALNPNLKRRQLLLGATCVGIGGVTALASAQPQPRIITVVAERYQFTPNEILLKKGETVILAFRTLDVAMGFNAPSFKVRTNILPDAPAQVQFTPGKAGKFPFFCDIVCGNGHNDMKGVIVVA